MKGVFHLKEVFGAERGLWFEGCILRWKGSFTWKRFFIWKRFLDVKEAFHLKGVFWDERGLSVTYWPIESLPGSCILNGRNWLAASTATALLVVSTRGTRGRNSRIERHSLQMFCTACSQLVLIFFRSGWSLHGPIFFIFQSLFLLTCLRSRRRLKV